MSGRFRWTSLYFCEWKVINSYISDSICNAHVANTTCNTNLKCLPLRMTQIGVVSFGNECAHPDYPGVYTRISSVLGWLSRYTGEETVWNFECEAVRNPDGKIFGMRQKKSH